MDQITKIEYLFELQADAVSIERKYKHDTSNVVKGETFKLPNNFERLDYELKTAREYLRAGEGVEIGTDLYQMLFVNSTIEDKFLEDIQNNHVSINIITKIPQYINYPWELLYSKKLLFLVQQDNISVSRNIPIVITSPSNIIDSKIKLLVTITSPKDESDIDISAEFDAMKNVLDPNLYEVDFLPQATADTLKTKISERQYHIIHFVGHGGLARGDGYILLRNHIDKSYWMSPQELASSLPSSVKLVCLSSGYTYRNYEIRGFNIFAQTRVDQNLPNMIVNQFQVNDSSYKNFWRQFYQSLREDGKLDSAVHKARIKVFEELTDNSHMDWASFVLHLRNNNEIFSFLTKKNDFSYVLSKEKTNEIKGLELQMDLFSSIINDLNTQIDTSRSHKKSLSKVADEIKEYHNTVSSKYKNLKRTYEEESDSTQ